MKSLEGIADADHEIEHACELRRHDRRAAPGHDVEPDVRSQRRNSFHQRRDQQLHREIRHHQAKLALAADGIEIVRNEKPAHLIERLRQRPTQRLSARRQFHPRADADQQGIAENVAQPLQGMARGRLRQSDPHGGAADIAFQQEGVERDKKVEVERSQIHLPNIYHINYRLEE
jgi:hypothetical protein